MRTKKERKKRKLKVISYWLFVIGFLFVVGCGFRIFRGFKGAVWDGEGRVNFVLVDEDIHLISLESREKRLEILSIFPDTEIEATRGYGKYRIGAVYELGKLEGMSGELLRESAQESLGVSVEGWIKIRDTGYGIRDKKKDLLKIFGGLILGRDGLTNFSRWDIFRLWWGTRKVLPHQIKVVQLGEIRALKSKVLIDGSKAWEIDQGRLDMWLQDNFYEPKIREENLTIRIINVTDHPGLATHVARIVSNMGGRVIEISNLKSQISDLKCEVRNEKEKRETFTVRKLMKALGCQWVEEEGDGRAEVTVLVGEDYWRMLKEN